MPQVAFLNERSQPTTAIPVEVSKGIVERLLDLMIALRQCMPRLSLISQAPLPMTAIGTDYSVAQWLNAAGVRRERKQFLLSLANYAPFRTARDLFGDRDHDGVTECWFRGPPFDGMILEGICLAHLYDGLAVSFDHDRSWYISEVPVLIEHLSDIGHERWETNVRHAALLEHVALHEGRLLELARSEVRNSQDLWNSRELYFPSLRFLSRVEADLLELQPPAFLQVSTWLFRMNDALHGWDPAERAVPQYPPHVTDEHEQRKGLCWFQDNGTSCLFSWHGRFTPGAGRIHFRLAANERKVVIAYIGPKL